MTKIDKIKNFLREAEDVSIGYSEINFIAADQIDEGQIGYSIDTEGNSLVTGQDGDWKGDWVVIGNDNNGDPLLIDTADLKLPILTAQHGDDVWEVTPIANSLVNFKIILSDLNELSKGRQTPVEMERNPIPKEVKKRFLNTIKINNENLDIWWWKGFIENDDDENTASRGILPKAIHSWWQKLFGS